MFLTSLTIIGTFATLIALIIAILSTSWSIQIKVTVLSISICSIAIPLFAYFYQIHAKNVYGTFEWQWAGENWVGVVKIEKNKEGRTIAEVCMNKAFKTQQNEDRGEYEIKKQVLASSSEGSIYGNKDGFKLILPVRKKIFAEERKVKEVREIHQTLEANLAPVEAYAGIVEYISQDGSVARGDMILVRYKSGIRLY